MVTADLFVGFILQGVFSQVIGSSESKKDKSARGQKRKKMLQVRDPENYLSYRPADHSTESG